MLYFVVRTDVAAHDGQQRVFACVDSEQEGNDFIVNVLSHLKGEFKVFVGQPVESK